VWCVIGPLLIFLEKNRTSYAEYRSGRLPAVILKSKKVSVLASALAIDPRLTDNRCLVCVLFLKSRE
jgi:hypothetical protein